MARCCATWRRGWRCGVRSESNRHTEGRVWVSEGYYRPVLAGIGHLLLSHVLSPGNPL